LVFWSKSQEFFFLSLALSRLLHAPQIFSSILTPPPPPPLPSTLVGTNGLAVPFPGLDGLLFASSLSRKSCENTQNRNNSKDSACFVLCQKLSYTQRANSWHFFSSFSACKMHNTLSVFVFSIAHHCIGLHLLPRSN
jgi:hypothetical protein